MMRVIHFRKEEEIEKKDKKSNITISFHPWYNWLSDESAKWYFTIYSNDSSKACKLNHSSKININSNLLSTYIKQNPVKCLFYSLKHRTQYDIVCQTVAKLNVKRKFINHCFPTILNKARRRNSLPRLHTHKHTLIWIFIHKWDEQSEKKKKQQKRTISLNLSMFFFFSVHSTFEQFVLWFIRFVWPPSHRNDEVAVADKQRMRVCVNISIYGIIEVRKQT